MNSIQLTGKLEENDFPVTGNKYLWIRNWESGNSYAELTTPERLFDYFDMEDCHDEEPEHHIYLLRPDKAPQPCAFYGIRHDWEHPLRMAIVSNRGKVLDIGYGTDH